MTVYAQRRRDAPAAPTYRRVKFINPDTCARKVSHESWALAEEHLLALIDQDHRLGQPRAALGLVTYRCRGCGLWHVGHGIGTDAHSQALRAAVRRARR